MSSIEPFKELSTPQKRENTTTVFTKSNDSEHTMECYEGVMPVIEYTRNCLEAAECGHDTEIMRADKRPRIADETTLDFTIKKDTEQPFQLTEESKYYLKLLNGLHELYGQQQTTTYESTPDSPSLPAPASTPPRWRTPYSLISHLEEQRRCRRRAKSPIPGPTLPPDDAIPATYLKGRAPVPAGLACRALTDMEPITITPRITLTPPPETINRSSWPFSIHVLNGDIAKYHYGITEHNDLRPEPIDDEQSEFSCESNNLELPAEQRRTWLRKESILAIASAYRLLRRTLDNKDIQQRITKEKLKSFLVDSSGRQSGFSEHKQRWRLPEVTKWSKDRAKIAMETVMQIAGWREREEFVWMVRVLREFVVLVGDG